jgi:hypothetical protein
MGTRRRGQKAARYGVAHVMREHTQQSVSVLPYYVYSNVIFSFIQTVQVSDKDSNS